jgi:hypothetical protein
VTTTDTGVFDTSKGTVHLVLGGGGTSANPTTGQAGAPNPNYTLFETIRLIRPRARRH